eukprot:g5197.t1
MSTRKCGQCRREQPSSYFYDGRRIYKLCLPCRVNIRKRKENVYYCIHENMARRCTLCQYPKFDPASLKHALTIEDLRVLAQRRVPKVFYDYVDSGSWTESTYRANKIDLSNLLLRQRAAGEFGVPFCLSTLSISSIEDIAQHAPGRPFWLQLYVFKDRDFVKRLLARAKAAGCNGLVMTLDLPLLGQRHKDIVNGLSVPMKRRKDIINGLSVPMKRQKDIVNGLSLPTKVTPAAVWDVMWKGRWLWHMSQTRRHSFGNLVGHVPGLTRYDVASLTEWVRQQIDPSLTWQVVQWVRREWEGKLVLKGIMDAEDAQKAADCGADAIIVSNHGGRQLDGTCSAVQALPAVVEAVRKHRLHPVEVWMDSGVRSGQDVLRARALGAQGVLIGRPYLYGLGAGGQEGVKACLNILSKELEISMALCGKTDITDVDESILLFKNRYPSDVHSTDWQPDPHGICGSAAAGITSDMARTSGPVLRLYLWL